MRDKKKLTAQTKVTAVLLCALISPLPSLLAQAAGAQRAGQVGALIPAATRNTQALKVKDPLAWNDLLKTLTSGRLRANLVDGSLLSMGSNSEMRVLQHDAASQQTELDLSFGRLRNRVVQLTKPGAKYEVKTPHAVIGVIGTDFYVFVDADRTLVICYTGKVRVTPRNRDSRDVQSGQMLEVRSDGSVQGPDPTPLAVQQDSIESTTVEERQQERGDGISRRKIPWIIALVAGIAIGIVIGTTGEQECSTSTSTSSSSNCFPTSTSSGP
ncbi:MAG: FecR family protein [Acidobacteria bacterium]|nr:FecR family protein [Acidobacteriota bacterium]